RFFSSPPPSHAPASRPQCHARRITRSKLSSTSDTGVTMRKFALLLIALVACNQGETPQSTTPAASAGKIAINGAGATFPNPIYSKWFSDYNKVRPNVQINYQPIGSGGGIKQLISQTVFFGATDGTMMDAQLKSASGPVMHFPSVRGARVQAPDLTSHRIV